jgi:hypothetical protein
MKTAIIVTNDNGVQYNGQVEKPSYLSSVITSHPTTVVANHSSDVSMTYDLDLISKEVLIKFRKEADSRECYSGS